MALLDEAAPGASVVVFDAYGTLFDVHAAVARHAGAIGPDAQALSDVWRAKQLEYSWVLSLYGGFRDFWQLTREALDHALARFPSVDPAIADKLLGAYRVLDAYQEAPAVLAALKARGLATAILSNGERSMLADAVASAGIGGHLDAVLSVDEVRVFKTSPAAYALVTRRFRIEPAQVAFVSSNRWDVAGATRFGFRAFWVNRAGAPDEYADQRPVAIVRDLNGLV